MANCLQNCSANTGQPVAILKDRLRRPEKQKCIEMPRSNLASLEVYKQRWAAASQQAKQLHKHNCSRDGNKTDDGRTACERPAMKVSVMMRIILTYTNVPRATTRHPNCIGPPLHLKPNKPTAPVGSAPCPRYYSSHLSISFLHFHSVLL